MIICQALNFGANLVAGAVLGALAVVAMRCYRRAGRDRLEPRYEPASEPPSTARAPRSPGGAADI
jgi:hypothetical protein